MEITNNLIISIVLCISFIVIVFFVVKILFALNVEKRLKGYTLANEKNNDLSFPDKIIFVINKFIKGFSNLIKKSVVLNDYSNKIEKYIIYFDKDKYEKIDYISIKFLVMFLIQLLYLFTVVIRTLSFNIYSFILISAVAFFLVDLIMFILDKNIQKKMEDGLLQAIVIMNNAFKSGKNITQAVDIVKNEVSSPMKEEFETISKDISYGLDLTVVFDRFYDRVKIKEAKYITSSLTLLSKTGGNIINVFSMIEKNFYDELKIRNELYALIASSKLMFRILLFLPFVFILIIILLNPSYFKPLYTSVYGFIVDGIILVLYVLYILIINKIMKVDKL